MWSRNWPIRRTRRGAAKRCRRTKGTGRDGFGKPKSFNFDRWWGMEGQHRPYMHTFYGLWLYGYRTGDWATIEKYWPDIKAFYTSNANKAELYGELGAHIAMARLARQFNDQPTETAATEWATRYFEAGKDYPAVEKLSHQVFQSS